MKWNAVSSSSSSEGSGVAVRRRLLCPFLRLGVLSLDLAEVRFAAVACFCCGFFLLRSSNLFFMPRSMFSMSILRAKELCTCFTTSKLPMASPRNAGGKSAVKSLNDERSGPRSAQGILLMMLRRETVAHALSWVWFANHICGGQVCSWEVVLRSSL